MQLSDHFPEMQGWTTVQTPVAKTPQIPNPETDRSSYLRATLPLPLQYQPDSLRQQNLPGFSRIRISPQAPNASPAAQAAATSTAIAASTQIVSGQQLSIDQFDHGNGATSRTVWTGDGTWTPKTNVVQVQIDFGFQVANEGDDAVVTVTGQSWVVAESVFVCSAAMEATADHDPDDVWAERIVAYVTNVVPSVGFDIVATSANEGGRTWGKYLIDVVGY